MVFLGTSPPYLQAWARGEAVLGSAGNPKYAALWPYLCILVPVLHHWLSTDHLQPVGLHGITKLTRCFLDTDLRNTNIRLQA